MSYDQPIPDPTAAHDPTDLHPLQPQNEFRDFCANLPTDSMPIDPIAIDFSQVQPSAVQQDLTYNIEIPDSIQLEPAPPTVSESQLDLTIAGEPQPRLRYRFDLPDDYELKGLPEYNPYPDVEITDPNILNASPNEDHDMLALKLPRTSYFDEGWEVDHAESKPEKTMKKSEPFIYRIFSPASPSRLGKGFNPNTRKRRRMPQFPSDVRNGVVCPHCGAQGVINGNGKCWDCGGNVYCKECGEPVGTDELCKNSACWYYNHSNDDPRCSDCHEFIEDTEVLCEKCKQKWSYAPL